MKTTLTFILILFNASIVFSITPPLFNGDLTFSAGGTYTMNVEMETVSLPFEGVTNPGQAPYGRYDSLLNGSIHKRFFSDSIYTYPIYYHQYSLSNSQSVTLSSCMVEDVHANNTDAWGMAKYKITLIIGTSTPKTFYFYWNSLDTAYGKTVGGITYKRDWEFIYDQAANGIVISGDAVNYDTLYLNENGKEYKVWELLLNRSTPVGRNFYARTTPFGITPEIVIPAIHPINELILGTTVILDTVYNNLGNSDRRGYNTIDTNGGGQNFFFYYSFPPIDGINDKGNTFCTPAKINFDNELGLNIIAQNGDTLILRKKKKLWISGQSTGLLGGDSLFFKNGSTLILEQNAEIFTCFRGGLVFEAGASASWNNSSCVRAFPNSGFKFSGSHTINNGGFMVIDSNATLKLNDSTILTFDGSDSYLNLIPTSQVKLGHNAKIVFKNGAYLRANGATFSQTSSGKISSGLVFENSGLDSIVNCTFSNAKTSITIKNDSVSFANANNNIIKGNTFNISQTNGIGIYATNVLKMLVYDNDFICSNSTSQFGIYFRNNSNFNGGSSYSLNILYNTFENGYLPLYLSCLAADRTPFYIVQNFFFGDNLYSMDLVKISGDVKSNTFDVYNYNSSIGLWNSSPNFFSNIIESRDFNMYLNHSFPKMSAVRTEDDKIMWESGKNIFNSEAAENMVLSGSYPAIDYGKNRFQIMPSTLFHLVGVLLDTNTFRMRFNCWAGHYDSAKFELFKYIDSTVYPVPAIYIPKYCTYPIIETAPSAVITDKGNGVFDTTIVSDDTFAFLIEDDEALLIQARSDFRRHFYPEATTNYKGLIDNYKSSMYLYTALDELFDCYSELDTASDPNETDVLFGDLKEYLKEKINSEEYDNTFNETAYDFLLICETRMEDYEIALTGYEFLALYHPDAEQRIIASWDYEDIEDLYGGEGGGVRSISNYKFPALPSGRQVSNKEQEGIEALNEFVEYKRLEKIISDDPVMRKLKKSWDNESKKKKEIQLKENNTDKVISSNAKVNPIQADKLISRAKENILRAKYLPKEEKEKRRMEDIVFLVGNGNTDTQTGKVTTSIPEVYELSQNYPNPFNPTTTVSYQLPKAGLVSITVYDITGKEVAKLVNEFKEAGSYNITFTASSLSSGIYFYSLRADGFTDTKKMVVIK